MFIPDRKILNWAILALITMIGAGISLYGYFKIISMPPLVYLPVTRPYPKTIFIDSPRINQSIKTPTTISGKARTSEGALTILIKDTNENVLQKTIIGNMKSNSPLPFSITIPFSKPATEIGKIEALETMPDDSETGQTTIPVLFSK